MIACTSPSATVRSIPFRISRPSASRACRLWISSIITGLPDAAFEADREELLRLDRELHRQLLQDVPAEAVDDQGQRVLVGEAALAAIEQLVVADLRGRRLVLDPGRRVAHLDIGNGVGAAAVADQQRVALRVVARTLGARLHPDEAPI